MNGFQGYGLGNDKSYNMKWELGFRLSIEGITKKQKI